MKKIFLFAVLLMSEIIFSVTAMAAIDVNIGISLPPPIVFTAPPDVIAMPDTDDAYVVPDTDVDIFFWSGWWWRPWEGRWYRSRYYNQGWVSYNNVPSFYYDVDPSWRVRYRSHNWYGHRWNYERIPNRELQHNWKNWHNDRHWERQRTWGVQAYEPRSHQQKQELRRQRQREYQQRPEVRRHQEQVQQQRRQIQVQQPHAQQQRQPYVQQPQPHAQQQRQPYVQQPQPHAQQQRQPYVQPQRQAQAQYPQRYQQPEQQHSQTSGWQQEVESKHKKSQEKPGRGDEEHRR
jgi:hypothetical protein